MMKILRLLQLVVIAGTLALAASASDHVLSPGQCATNADLVDGTDTALPDTRKDDSGSQPPTVKHASLIPMIVPQVDPLQRRYAFALVFHPATETRNKAASPSLSVFWFLQTPRLGRMRPGKNATDLLGIAG